MWRLLQRKYGFTVKRLIFIALVYFLPYDVSPIHFRQTVMMLQKVLDPEGVKRRRGKRLHRRVYYNKVRGGSC